MENQQQSTTILASLRPQALVTPERYTVGLTDSQGFELAQRAAKLLASSSLVPTMYQGNISNCVIALNMANRMGADPLMVMQNLVIVYNKPSWSSKFLIATVNSCGRFSALRFEYFGEQGTDTWGCHAVATEKSTGEKLVGPDITIKLAKLEGWHDKNGSKWQTMPQKMLMYRAGGWWCDVYAPELSMGLRTEDENYDIIDIDTKGNVLDPIPPVQTIEKLKRQKKDVTPPPQVTSTDPETGEIKAKELTVDEMNQMLALVDEIKLLRNDKDSIIKDKMPSHRILELDKFISENFHGQTIEKIMGIRDYLANLNQE